MAMVTMREMLQEARRGGYAVGAFEFWSYDSARAVLEAARSLKVPAILQVGPFERDYMDGYDGAVALAQSAARRIDVDFAVHLDHAETYEQTVQALDAGFSSVMIDGSALPYEENVALTRRVVEKARAYGASVEAELGKLAGNEGEGTDAESEEADQTPVDAAADFVTATGIDALAVAIGTAHGLYKRPPKLNLNRLEEITKRVSIPLVLHGGSGTPMDAVQQAIHLGIAKVNICTEFIQAFGNGYLAAKQSPDFKNNVPCLFAAGRDQGQALAWEKMRCFLAGREA